MGKSSSFENGFYWKKKLVPINVFGLFPVSGANTLVPVKNTQIPTGFGIHADISTSICAYCERVNVNTDRLRLKFR